MSMSDSADRCCERNSFTIELSGPGAMPLVAAVFAR